MGMGLESPALPGKEVCNLDFPCIPTAGEVYNMQEMFGGALHCTADEPFDIYGLAGVGVAPNEETLLTLGVNGL
ncbi:unnamed protein product [marine sediment metagenome]|uniref:Uncharacterized protein n=1 Tax=marine sediment metagenome TaxID=412755 RepID=X1BRB0_9ZZZZ